MSESKKTDSQTGSEKVVHTGYSSQPDQTVKLSAGLATLNKMKAAALLFLFFIHLFFNLH